MLRRDAGDYVETYTAAASYLSSSGFSELSTGGHARCVKLRPSDVWPKR
jgi:hypothetical protein